MDINQAIEETTLTLDQISKQLGVSQKRVRAVWAKYPSDFRRNRKAGCYSRSKQGALNPMLGKVLDQHPRYIGAVSDCKGYLMVVKPEWYTGRRGSHHVFMHSVVMCEHLGITEIPQGWCVHHCDENPHNNVIDNLIMMTMADHMKWHGHVRAGVTTMAKASTAKWLEAHGTPFRCNEIVCSA